MSLHAHHHVPPQHLEPLVKTRLAFGVPAELVVRDTPAARELRVGTPAEEAAASAVQTVRPEERATESIDIRVFLGLEVPLPELGNKEDSGSSWSTTPELRLATERATELDPEHAAQSGSQARQGTAPMRCSAAVSEEHESADLLRSPRLRQLSFAALAIVALGLLCASFAGRAPKVRPIPSLPSRAQATASPQALPQPALLATELTPSEHLPAPPQANGPAVDPAEQTPQLRRDRNGARAERGAATARSAADLYLKGQYKEALAEYRLLASTYPEQTVYAEVARILKRKLFDTCVRTQPHRREQCKQL